MSKDEINYIGSGEWKDIEKVCKIYVVIKNDYNVIIINDIIKNDKIK